MAILTLVSLCVVATGVGTIAAASFEATAHATTALTAHVYDASPELVTLRVSVSPAIPGVRMTPNGTHAVFRESQAGTIVGVFAAKSVPGAADDIAVIGRQWDTAVAKDWPGHEVLDIPKWSPAKNDAWVNGIIERQQRVYIASPKTKANLWDAVNNRTTVFGRELGQLFDAGYMRSGDYLLPPG